MAHETTCSYFLENHHYRKLHLGKFLQNYERR
jgi:hypothetical protein